VVVLVLAIFAVLLIVALLARRRFLPEDAESFGAEAGPAKVEPKTPTFIDLYAARLALSPGSWVSRRVERFDFLDATTVRRHMSIDFVLPALPPSEEPDREGSPQVLVPLMLLKRGMLRGLDVTDADGRSLNVIESAAGSAVMLAGIRDFVARVTGKGLENVPASGLERIFTFDPERARNAAKSALDPRSGEIGRLLDEIPSPDDADEKKRKEAEGFRTELIETVKALVTELASGFPLLVSVPYRPDVPSLVKVSYDTWIESTVRDFWRARKRRAAARLFASRVFSSLALVGRVEYFAALEVRRSRSYHAEVVPAPGTYCEEANLCLRRPDKDTQSDGSTTRGVYRDFDHSRPHLWVGDSGDGTDRAEQGVLEVSLFASRDGLILPLFFSAALIAGVLSLVLARHPDVDGITLGALLLAPVALATYYARSDENGYLTMAMRLVRRVALLSITAAVTAVVMISLGYVEAPDGNGRTRTLGTPTALRVMEVAAWVALICAVLLALAWCAPVVNEFARRFWFKADTRPLPRRGKVGQPNLRMTLTPALVLFIVGAAATIALARILNL
jgi:hypothetical protein